MKYRQLSIFFKLLLIFYLICNLRKIVNRCILSEHEFFKALISGVLKHVSGLIYYTLNPYKDHLNPFGFLVCNGLRHI